MGCRTEARRPAPQAAHQVAQRAVADERDAGVGDHLVEASICDEQDVVGHPGLPVAADRPELGSVDGRVEGQLGDPRLQQASRSRNAWRVPRRGRVARWSAKTTPASAAGAVNGKADIALGLGSEQAERQGEVQGQLEVDVEELRVGGSARRDGRRGG